MRDRLVLRADRDDLRGCAAHRADDARLVARGGEGRCERLLAAVAARRPRVPEVVRLGPVAAIGRIDDAAHAATSPRAAHEGDSILGNPAPTFIWGGGGWPTPGRPRPTTTQYSHMRPSKRRDAADQRRAGLRHAAAGRDEASCCRTCRTATRSCCRASATRATSGRSSRRRARASSTRSSTPARWTTRSTRRSAVDFTPEVTQTALGKGIAGAMIGLALADGALAAADGARVHRRGRLRPQGERRARGRCTRSCSASAAGSSACSS